MKTRLGRELTDLCPNCVHRLMDWSLSTIANLQSVLLGPPLSDYQLCLVEEHIASYPDHVFFNHSSRVHAMLDTWALFHVQKKL